MKFTTKNLRYSILAGLAAYGTYMIAIQIIGAAYTLPNCYTQSDGMIPIICYIFGVY